MEGQRWVRHRRRGTCYNILASATLLHVAGEGDYLVIHHAGSGWNAYDVREFRLTGGSIIAIAHLQSEHPLPVGTKINIYRGFDGKAWCRSVVEFDDGRFEHLAARPAGDDVA